MEIFPRLRMSGTMPLFPPHGILAWTRTTFTRFILYADFKVRRFYTLTIT